MILAMSNQPVHEPDDVETVLGKVITFLEHSLWPHPAGWVITGRIRTFNKKWVGIECNGLQLTSTYWSSPACDPR
jgi:hypothetical protein